MNAVTVLDGWLQREAPAGLSFAAFVISGVILFGALPLGVADYSVYVSGLNGQVFHKQLGIWLGGINWVMIFLVIYPLFLSILAKISTTIREVIRDLHRGGMLSTEEPRDDAEDMDYERMLDIFLSRQARAVFMIGVGTLVVTLLLWGAVARDIITCSTGDHLLSWATGILKVNKCSSVTVIFVYSIIVYAWLGVIVFSYMTSLLFCTLYSSFLGQLFSGNIRIGKKGKRVFLKVGGNYLAILKSFTFELSMICTLGLVTIFFMNLELAYLVSPAGNLREFLMQYATSINRFLSRYFVPQLLRNNEAVATYQDDLIALPSFMLFAVTILSFTVSIYSIWRGVRHAILNGELVSPKEPPVSIIFMGFRPNMIAALVLSVSSFVVDVGLAIFATVAIRLVIYLLTLARTFPPNGPTGGPASKK